MAERFYVTETWGYLTAITGSVRTPPVPEVCVHDRFDCHKTVWSSLSEKSHHPKARASHASRYYERDRRRADTLARRLNNGQMDAVA